MRRSNTRSSADRFRPWWTASIVVGALAALIALGSTAWSQTTPPKSDGQEKPGDFAKPGDDSKEDADKDAADKSGAKDKDKDKDSEDEPKSSAEEERGALPRGMLVPAVRPPEFSIDDPKTTEEQWKNWSRGKAHSDFMSAVQAGNRDGASDKAVQAGIREQLAAMTLPAMRDPKGERFQISEIVQGLLRTVHQGATSGGKGAGDQRQYRIFLMQEIIKDVRELKLATNHYYVRLNVAVLLGNMFIEEANAATKADPEFYTPAFEPLLEVLEVPGQSESVKLTALNGLRNACLYGSPPLQVADNVRLAKRLIQELEKPNANEWYQWRLCDTLSTIEQVHDLNGQPFIVQALSVVLFDTSRPLCARAAAARALGRTPLDPSIELNVITYGITDLARQMVEARNSGKRKVTRWCVADVCLAFLPKDSPEKSRRAGLLDRVDEPTYSRYRKAVTQAWAVIRPMVVEELRHRAEPDIEFPQEVLTGMVDWLKGNTPSDYRISPGMPSVTTTQVTKVDANGRK